MSDAESREGSQEVDLSQLDTSEQLEPSADGQVEDSTQEPTEEVFETVELNDLVGETKAESDEEKEKNKLYASNRVMSKKLKQLEEQVSQGNIPSEFAFNPDDIGEEPSIKDYQARLYDEFDGSEAIMIAKYQEDLRKFERKTQGISTQREQHLDSVKQHIQAEREAESQFDASTESLRKIVPTIDDSLVKAEQLLGERDFNAIRDTVGANAPLVLGLIGTNKQVQMELSDAVSQGSNALVKYLTRLEDSAVSRLPQKTVSRAGGESPLSGGSHKTIDFDAEITKVGSDPKLTGMERVNKIKELRAQRDSAS